MNFTATVPTRIPGQGAVTGLLASLRRAGKTADVLIASMHDVAALAAIPVPSAEGVSRVPQPRYAETEVLVVEELNRAHPSLESWVLEVAASPQAARVHFPKLEAVLFV